MKWRNKGHEFDEVYNALKEVKEYYFFGAGFYGKAFYEFIKGKINVKGFIDNNPEKQKNGYLGMPVYPLDQIECAEGVGIIITMSRISDEDVYHSLKEKGFVLNKNVFQFEIAMILYSAYEDNKFCVPHVSFLPSTVCNLNCAACLNFNPYAKRKVVRELDKLKESIDIFFSRVHYLMYLHISGGEPLLYPHLAELIEYIAVNYKDKMGTLAMTTNGSIYPSEDVLKAIKKYNVRLKVDDYREAEIPEYSNKYDELIRILEEHEIYYVINKVDKWIDLKPTETDHSDWSEERLQEHYAKCRMTIRDYRDGCVYSCVYASFAEVAGIGTVLDDEKLDLRNCDDLSVKELAEYWLGYNEKGYMEFCKHCRGYLDGRQEFVQPAKQFEG